MEVIKNMAEYGYILAFSSRQLKKQKSAIFGRGGLQRMANVLNFMFFLNLFSILPFPGSDRGKET